jgi:hypothetical protein
LEYSHHGLYFLVLVWRSGCIIIPKSCRVTGDMVCFSKGDDIRISISTANIQPKKKQKSTGTTNKKKKRFKSEPCILSTLFCPSSLCRPSSLFTHVLIQIDVFLFGHYHALSESYKFLVKLIEAEAFLLVLCILQFVLLVQTLH